MKILIVTDAWLPQTNGVVRALREILPYLERAGHEVRVVGPDQHRFFCVSMPGYRSIPLEFLSEGRLRKIVSDFQPEAVHIATEGPLGWTARKLCMLRKIPFTTALHTRFPEYAAARLPRILRPLIVSLGYQWLRFFHKPARTVLVSTLSLEKDLLAHGFTNVGRWPLGVAAARFQQGAFAADPFSDLPRPILLYVGRVAIEKNLPAFLKIETEGTKIVIGDGPDLARWKKAYPDVSFLGRKPNAALGPYYAHADLFVFPSKTDTFGLVLLEACAAGLRCACYPAPGPLDVFADPESSRFVAIDRDLQKAVDRALLLPRDPPAIKAFAAKFSWESTARSFLNYLSPLTLNFFPEPVDGEGQNL
jgi:glycosyltransferase involved in cell wall biosynthesis